MEKPNIEQFYFSFYGPSAPFVNYQYVKTNEETTYEPSAPPFEDTTYEPSAPPFEYVDNDSYEFTLDNNRSSLKKKQTKNVKTDTINYLSCNLHRKILRQKMLSASGSTKFNTDEYYESIAENFDELIILGEWETLKLQLTNFTKKELVTILNLQSCSDPCSPSYHGNRLHTLLFYSNDDEAEEMYKLFRKHGAIPIKNFYGELPHQQKKSYWPLLDASHRRNIKEFKKIYGKINKYEHFLSFEN
jgi:hypothetical protein